MLEFAFSLFLSASSAACSCMHARRAIECFKVAVDIQPHDSSYVQLGKVRGSCRNPRRQSPGAK